MNPTPAVVAMAYAIKIMDPYSNIHLDEITEVQFAFLQTVPKPDRQDFSDLFAPMDGIYTILQADQDHIAANKCWKVASTFMDAAVTTNKFAWALLRTSGDDVVRDRLSFQFYQRANYLSHAMSVLCPVEILYDCMDHHWKNNVSLLNIA
jgi:hypothetical protein